MCGRSFLISSNSYLFRSCELTDKNPQVAYYHDGQSPRNKASKIQKLEFWCYLLTSAKAKKFLVTGDQLYTATSL